MDLIEIDIMSKLSRYTFNEYRGNREMSLSIHFS